MAVINDHVTQTVIQPTTIDATIDMQVLNDAPLDAPLTLDEFSQSESFLSLWQTLTQLLGSGGLQKDHPSLIALVDLLKQQGVLPSSGTLTSGDLTTFHQWFRGLETDQFSDSMTYFEGLILYQWNESLPSPMMDQVIVFDALNAFNQYAIYCQVIVGDEVVTLNYQEARPIQYDESQHGSFGILLSHQWVDQVDSAPVNYATAHTILDLSPEDRLALDEWLATVFPNGWDHLSDEDMIMAVYTKLLSDEFEYQPDIGDQWASVSQFLDSKTGDCEEFSHLFYSALQVLFESSEHPPTVQVLAGLVGSGLQTYGHSLVQVTLGDTSVVIDLTGEKTPATSLSDFPTLDAYIEVQSFDEMLRYDHMQTTLNVEAQALRNFSTSSSMEDELELQYKAVFGQDSSFQSVTSTNDADYTIDGYDSLIKKVIGLEMVRLLESGQMNGTNVVLMSELSAFQYVHAYQPTGDFGLTTSDVFDINEILWDYFNSDGFITRETFSFLTDDQYSAVFSELTTADPPLVVESFGNHVVANNFGSAYFTGTNQDIFQKLIELGFISSSGLIDLNALNDATKIEALRSFYTVNGNVIPMADELLAFLGERAYVYADVASVGSSDPFESALLRFEQLSEELFHGLTASTTPIYAAPEVNGRQLFSLSEFVVNNGYVEGGENSLFIRIDHQKLQQKMSMFYSLQNTISAFMTIAFSISDMVSSISAKLGEENSTASSSSKQRQKIMQVFNSYAGGISESLNNLTDVFNQSVQKTNESRYQTALSQIDFEYSDFRTQLSDAFSAKEYTIEKENLKAELSQDYYRMLRDNRQSMQRAMIDVPNFGPNIMPSMFSHFFIDQPDQYHGLTSMQIWSALYAHGVIDEYGLLKPGVDLTTTSMIDLSDALPLMSSSTPEAKRMNGLLHEQFAQFKDHWVQLTVDEKDYFLTSIRELLVNHQRMIPSTSTSSGNGMQIVHAGMGAFDTSRYLFAVMDLMERESDSTHAMNAMFEDGFFDALRNADPSAAHNTFGSNMVSEESLQKYELYEYYNFQISPTSDFFQYRDLIDAFLMEAFNQDTPMDPTQYTFLPENERDGFHQFLISSNYIGQDLDGNYYVNNPAGSTQYTYSISPSLTELFSFQAEIDQTLIRLLNDDTEITTASMADNFDYLSSDQQTQLYNYMVEQNYISNDFGAQYVCLPPASSSNQPVRSADILSILRQYGVIDSSGAILDAKKLAPGQPARQAIDDLFSRGLQGSQHGELLYQDLRARQNPDALHLTSSASAKGETGSGFQVLDADMVNLARKNFMLMNAVRRVYMSLVSAQTQFFERIASKLSKDATSSSHYGDMQSSLMESHMGIAERQLSSIQSDTIQMVSRINDLHKMRLNIVKMGDPVLRALDMTSTWTSIIGALMMLTPTPMTQFIGIFLTMASQILSLAESWRGLQLEDSLHQRMDESAEMGELGTQVGNFFRSNLQTGDSGTTPITTGAGAEGVATDVIPRSVVDYANAHLYINPDSTHVQQLLHESVFPNGVPTRSEDIIRGVHAFMNQQTTYRSDDPSGDDWASVDDTAQTLSGDCEDLVNLEHSLLLAAFQASGGGHQQPTSHAAYVQVDGQRVGHVYLTIDLDGETVVLDPSLETDGNILPLDEYQQKYHVEDVFTYTDQRTNVLNTEALGIQTSGFLSDVADGFIGVVGGALSEVFGTLFPDDFIELFIPDISDGSVFDGRFQFEQGASDDEIIRTLTTDTLDIMFDTFMGNASQDNNPIAEFFGDMTADAFRLVMEPLILSFAPGTAGHDISTSVMGELTGIANRVLGDAFTPDREQIQQTLSNRYSGTQHSPGIEGGTIDDILLNLQNQIRADFDANNDHVMSQYQFQLSRDSSFYMYQPQIDALLIQCFKDDTEMSPDSFDFLSSSQERTALFEELQGLNYIIDEVDGFYVRNPTFQSSYGHQPHAAPLSTYSTSAGPASALDQQTLFDELISYGYIARGTDNQYYVVNVPGNPTYRLPTYSRFKSQESQISALLVQSFSNDSPIVSGSFSSLMTPPTLSTDYTSMIHSLFQDQEQLTTGFFAQNISPSQPEELLNNQFFSADAQQKRVILNQYNVDHYKDGLRIVQEQLRFVFLLVKAVSDALATLAANIGDNNKVKVASGLQKIFETSFGLVNNDIQLREHLLSHYASAVNHNFEVDKIRYEREIDSRFKTGTFLAVMIFPMYGQLIDSAISIFQTLAMYYDWDGLRKVQVINNPYSNKYLMGNYFNADGYLQNVALQRYALSTTDAQTRSDLTSNPANQVSLQSNGQVHPLTLDAVVNFRQESFRILKEASQIPPKEQGVRLTLPWVNQHDGEEVTLKSVDYNAFNQKRTELIQLGMRAQSSIVMFMSLTGYLSSLTEAIRGDGKVGAQHISSMIDVIEREVMHDIDALDAIQSMQESAVSFNNRHFESLKRVEKVCYEAIFFGAYFTLSKFIPISPWGILMVKALSNMFQGIMLSYVNYRGAVENELDREDYFGREYNESANANVRVSAYGANGEASTIDYSGISNYENNYLGFSNDRSKMILDNEYSNNWLYNALGLGFKSVNWFEFAYQNIMLKKLFTQWNLMLKQGETVAEAYQNIADELGASVSSLSYSRFLKSQMSMKKTGMMKNMSNRFSAAGEMVGVFNSIQSERFETFQQFVKTAVLGAFKWWLGSRQKTRDKKMGVLKPDSASGKNTFLTKDFKLNMLAEWGEDILRFVAGSVRTAELSHRQAQLMQDAEQQYLRGTTSQHARLVFGSATESMLYVSNIKKAKQKVNADIISKLSYFQGFFKDVIKNIIDDWSKKAKAIGDQQLKGDASFVKDQSKSFSSSLMSGDHASAQRKLTEISAYLMDRRDSNVGLGFVGGILGNIGRSIKSTFTRSGSKNYHGSINQLEFNNGVWTSIRRSYKQMIRYGGAEDARAFATEMQTLKKDIQRLHQINLSRSEQQVIVSMDQLTLLQRISTGLRTLHQMMERYDDYRQSPKNGKFLSDANIFKQIYKRIFQSQYGQLGVIATNVESFALHGTVSTVVSLNKYHTQKNKEDAQQLFQAMKWLHDVAQTDPRRVYRSIGDMLTQLSHKKDEQSQLATFLEDSLKDQSMDRNALAQMQRDFVKRVLACQQGGFKLIMDLLKKNHTNQQLIDLLSDGSDGVVDLALKMGNEIGAKRLLHALSYSGVSEYMGHTFSYGSHQSSTGVNVLKDWMLTPEKSKRLAALLVKTQHVDERQAHDLTDGSWFTKNSWYRMVGWRRHYTERLERALNLAMDDYKSAKNDSKLKALQDFLDGLNSSDLHRFRTSLGADQPTKTMAQFYEKDYEKVEDRVQIKFQDPETVIVDGDKSNIDRALQWKVDQSGSADDHWYQSVYNNHPEAFIKAVLRLSNKGHRRRIIEHIEMRHDASPTERLQLHIISGLQKPFELTHFQGHIEQRHPNAPELDGAVQWQTIDWSGLYGDRPDTPDFINEPKLHALREWLLQGLYFEQMGGEMEDEMGGAIDSKSAHQLNQNRQQMLQYIPGRVLKQLLARGVDQGQGGVDQAQGGVEHVQSTAHETIPKPGMLMPPAGSVGSPINPGDQPVLSADSLAFHVQGDGIGDASEVTDHLSADSESVQLTRVSDSLYFLTDALTYQPDLAVLLLNQDQDHINNLTPKQIHRLADVTSWVSDANHVVELYKKMLPDDDQGGFSPTSVAYQYIQSLLLFHPNGFDSLVTHMDDRTRESTLRLMEAIIKQDQAQQTTTVDSDMSKKFWSYVSSFKPAPKDVIKLPKIPDQALEKAMFSLSGYNLAAYDSLSLSQRTELLSLASGDLNAPTIKGRLRIHPRGKLMMASIEDDDHAREIKGHLAMVRQTLQESVSFNMTSASGRVVSYDTLSRDIAQCQLGLFDYQELRPCLETPPGGHASPDKTRHQSTYESLQATARASSGADVQANSSEGIGNIGNTCYFNSAIQLLRVLPIGVFDSAYDYLQKISGDSIEHGVNTYRLPEATKAIRDNTLEVWKNLLHPNQTSCNHEASVRTILSQFPEKFPIGTQGDPGELINFAFMQVFLPDASAFESERGIDTNAHDFGYAIESSTVDVLDAEGEVMASTTKQTPVWISSARASESVDECLPEILPESERLKEMNGSRSLNGHSVESLKQRKTVTIQRGTNNITLKDVKRTSFNRRTNSYDRDTAHQSVNMDSLQAVIFHSGTATGGHYTSLRKVDEKYLKISDSTVEKLTRDQAETYLAHHGHQIKMILQNNHADPLVDEDTRNVDEAAHSDVSDESVDEAAHSDVSDEEVHSMGAVKSDADPDAEARSDVEPKEDPQLWLKGVCQSLVDLKNKESAHGMPNGVLLHQKAHDFFTKHKECIKGVLNGQMRDSQVVEEALWYFAPSVAAKLLPNEDQVRRISNRVQYLVADSMLRQHGGGYRPVSEITTQFSLIPKSTIDSRSTLQDRVFVSMMDQFNSLSAHHSLASGARMFDVVDAIVSSDVLPTLQSISNASDFPNDTGHVQQFQALEVLQRVQGFLDSLIDNGVVLNKQQQQRFLALLEQCSSKFDSSLYPYVKNNDSHAFASKMHGIEKIVGLTGIQAYLATKYDRMCQDNLFLKSLRQRVDLAVQESTGDPAASSTPDGDSAAPSTPEGDPAASSTPDGDSAASSTPEGDSAASSIPEGDSAASSTPEGDSAASSTPDWISKLRQFRHQKTQFFNPEDFVSNMTALHQFSPGDFNEACVELGRLDSSIRDPIIDQLVTQISFKCDDNQAKMMHKLLFSMHEDHKHPRFLRDFMTRLNEISGFKTSSGLFYRGRFEVFLTQAPLLRNDRLTELQSYFVKQFREEFYVSQQSIRNQTMTLEKYFGRALNKEAVSNLIYCVVRSRIPEKKSAGWMMVAQLLSEHEGKQTRAQKAQLVQYVIHELMKHSPPAKLNENIQCLLKHVPASNQEGVRAEISHYFKGKTFVKPTNFKLESCKLNFKFKEFNFRGKPVPRPTWGSVSRGMSQFFGREHTTTSYSSDPNHGHYQNLLYQTIEAIKKPASPENKEANERLLAHLIIQAASHKGSEDQLNGYIGSLSPDDQYTLAKKCELLISEAQLESLKKAYTDKPFGKFVRLMRLSGAKQTHLRAQLVKASMVQKIKTDDVMLKSIFNVMVDYAKYARNFENGSRTTTFSVSHVNSSLSIGG